MFRTTDIQNGLLRLIGWRQNEDELVFALDKALLATESGKVYQQAHALLTLPNIKAIAPDFGSYTYNQYSSTKAYIAGDKVDYQNILYRALIDSTGIAPDTTTDPPTWKTFDPFSEWLDTKVKDSISKAITRFIDEKLSYAASKNLVENKVLFDGAARIADVDTTSVGIAGFEIIPIRARSITVRIDRIGAQFTAPGTLNIYVYHSSKEEYYKKITIDMLATNSVQWNKPIDLFLPYLGDDTDAGGSWYICYDFAELVDTRPIIKSKDWSKAPCEGCESASAGFKALSQYIEVYPFNAKVTRTDDKLWDILENEYQAYNNYGLNLELSVLCDITDFVLTQKQLFSGIILLQFAVDMLKEMCYNPNVRINRNALMAQRNELIFAIDGDTSAFRKSGLSWELDKAYKGMDVDLSKIDKICLPCKNGGLKYRSV